MPMPRIRTTIVNMDDREEQLRRAFRVRQDLIENLRVYLDPEYPLQGVHRDDQKRAYFEVAADRVDAIRELLHARGYDDHTEVSVPDHPNGEGCANCGNIAGPKLPPVCPNCGFRDIAPCPIGGAEVAREDYRKIAVSLFECPDPKGAGAHRVRLAFNDPLFHADGAYRQPLVVACLAEEG
jgi:hypothetical protein